MNHCLTIVLPKVFEEDMVDHLLEHPEWVCCFTTAAVNGHGHQVAYRGSAEEVRGRVALVQAQIVAEQANMLPLLDHLKQSLRSPEITYWITPVAEFASFA